LAGCAGRTRVANAATETASPPAATLPSGPEVALAGRPFIVPGENITWDVSFAGISGGRARLAGGALGEEHGQRVVVLRAEAESAGVVTLLKESHDSVVSWIDADSGLPTRTESTSSGGSSGKPVVVHAERTPGLPTVLLRIWSSKGGDEGTRKEQK